jgi:hypothetical protein
MMAFCLLATTPHLVKEAVTSVGNGLTILLGFHHLIIDLLPLLLLNLWQTLQCLQHAPLILQAAKYMKMYSYVVTSYTRVLNSVAVQGLEAAAVDPVLDQANA